jgi:hypothetical protein
LSFHFRRLNQAAGVDSRPKQIPPAIATGELATMQTRADISHGETASRLGLGMAQS